VSFKDLWECHRFPILAALLTDDLVSGRAVVEVWPFAAALRFTTADPNEVWKIRGLSPAQRAEIERDGANFQSVTEWRHHHKKLHKAKRRAADRARWKELCKAAEREAAVAAHQAILDLPASDPIIKAILDATA
jgi:hypothetical protein